jgi:hypothetical protein
MIFVNDRNIFHLLAEEIEIVAVHATNDRRR